MKKLLGYILSKLDIILQLNILKYIRKDDKLERGCYYLLNADKLQIYKYVGYGSVYCNSKNISAEDKSYNIFIRTGLILTDIVLRKCIIKDIYQLPSLTMTNELNQYVFNIDNHVLDDMVINYLATSAPVSIYRKSTKALVKINMPLNYSFTIKQKKFAWKLQDNIISFELES
jgi:hypothetical protein